MKTIYIDTPDTRKPRKGGPTLVKVKPRLGAAVGWNRQVWEVWSLGSAVGCWWLIRHDDDPEEGAIVTMAHVHVSQLSLPPQTRRQ